MGPSRQSSCGIPSKSWFTNIVCCLVCNLLERFSPVVYAVTYDGSLCSVTKLWWMARVWKCKVIYSRHFPFLFIFHARKFLRFLFIFFSVFFFRARDDIQALNCKLSQRMTFQNRWRQHRLPPCSANIRGIGSFMAAFVRLDSNFSIFFLFYFILLTYDDSSWALKLGFRTGR